MAKLDPLDKLFSHFVRLRALARVNGCERCLTQKFDILKDNGSVLPAWKQLQCSHYHGKNNKSVRWDEDNAAGLCPACHMLLEHNPHLHEEWFKNYLGESAYDLLLARQRITGKPDRSALFIYYNAKIKELDKEIGEDRPLNAK